MPAEKWFLDWPEEEGFYWFYGHRFAPYGKDKEMMLVEVKRASNAFIYIAKGNFMWEKEAVGAWMKAVLPKPPSSKKDFKCTH